MSKETAEIRDQLGNDPDVFQVLNANYYEEFGIEEGPLKKNGRTIGDAFILNHTTNGKSGTTYVLGSDYGALSLKSVTNNNNMFVETFAFDDFIDSSNTTATVDTTNAKVIF